MASWVAGADHAHRAAGLGRRLRIGKQILTTLVDHAAAAAERSRFAALPPRYLEDVGMTECDRFAALGYEEPAIDGWRVVASHL